MKYCKDCKWLVPSPDFADAARKAEYSKCCSPKARVDMVSGEPIVVYCSSQRNAVYASETCGPDAQWFEPKEAAP